jgi:very-short-patch-repair endonuclease
LFGDHWHQGENPNNRAKIFEPFGYKTLVIWGSELQKEPDLVKSKIREFCNS